METLNFDQMASLEGGRKMTYSCGLALAGAVAATAGFAFVTGGAGLIVALVGKGLATASLIDSCS